MLVSVLAAFCTHPVCSKLRQFHPSTPLSPYSCAKFLTHFTDSHVTTKRQEAVSSVSTIQKLFCGRALAVVKVLMM